MIKLSLSDKMALISYMKAHHILENKDLITPKIITKNYQDQLIDIAIKRMVEMGKKKL